MSVIKALKSIETVWAGGYADVPWTRQSLSLTVLEEGPRLCFHLLFGDLAELPDVALELQDGARLTQPQDGHWDWILPEGQEGVRLKIADQLQGCVHRVILTQSAEQWRSCPVVVLQSMEPEGAWTVIYNSQDRLLALRAAINSCLSPWRTPWASALGEAFHALLDGDVAAAVSRVEPMLHGESSQGVWRGLVDRAGGQGRSKAEETGPEAPAPESQSVDPKLLEALISRAQALDADLLRAVRQDALGGDLGSAIRRLERLGATQLKDQGAGPLMIHLYHQAGRHLQANAMLDRLIGLDMSRHLVIDNCPSEDQIIARWNKPQSEAVSIICTTYNHARFIGMALSGFFSQITTHPFEVVVRNDASTDATAQILQAWQAKYPRLLRVVTTAENTYSQGMPAMPQAIALAHHPYVAMCEGDDFWSDFHKIERQASLLSRHPEWSAVTHNHYELNEFSGTLSHGRGDKQSGLLPRAQLLLSQPVLWVHTVMYRRDRLKLPAYTHFDDVLGDQIFTTMLGIGGPVYYIGDLLGSVARRNLASTFTPLSEADKLRKRLTTRVYLARLLAECGEQQLAEQLNQWCEGFRRKHAVDLPAVAGLAPAPRFLTAA